MQYGYLLTLAVYSDDFFIAEVPVDRKAESGKEE